LKKKDENEFMKEYNGKISIFDGKENQKKNSDSLFFL